MNKFEQALLENHINWFKTTSHEEREKYLQERVDAMNDETYRIYSNFCKAHGVEPRVRHG